MKPVLVVGVGASAGGLEAFKRLLGALPTDTGMAFVLVQHLDPNHHSILTDLLSRSTDLEVKEAEHGAVLEPNHVYVIRPDTFVGVEGRRLVLSPPTLSRGIRLPVDHLFRSLARALGPAAAGILLSGAGSDGTAGMRDMRAAGGLTIVQQPETASQPGMPQSAVDANLVDLVLPIEEMPRALQRFARLTPEARSDAGRGVAQPSEPDPRTDWFTPEHASTLNAILGGQGIVDVGAYKARTVGRRVWRRMALSGHDSPRAYFDFLREDEEEQRVLVRDLLIGVTSFFRDAEAFEALRTEVLTPLIAEERSGEALRVWVPGCATGEEAYSIAMMLLEVCEERLVRRELKIFATDVDEEALAVARRGHYAASVAEDVSEERLKRFFYPKDQGYQVRDAVRDLISFARHDLVRQPPFSRIHLVSCRNVLIYLRPEWKERILGLFHFALLPDGFLFLGTSESVGKHKELFSTVSKRWRIYRKVKDAEDRRVARPHFEGAGTIPSAAWRPAERSAATDRARRQLMQALLPPTVLITPEGEVAYMHGELRPYLRFPNGEPRHDVSSLWAPELASRARTAVYRCRRDGEPVELMVVGGPENHRICITARPADDFAKGAVMVSFAPVPAPADTSAPPEAPGQEGVIRELEGELRATREDLRSTVEELESSNEELRASNEETTSMNEELQSANEELEATTEELRSLNEELSSVNLELREKIAEVEQAHDDLTNFFASTKIATLFLDHELRIVRSTPAARTLLQLEDDSHGRCVEDLARELVQRGLAEEARLVLEELTPRSQDIELSDGRWITRTVLPYRAKGRRIAGVVVTFIDITELKRTAEALAVRERQQAVIARLGLNALEQPDPEDFLSLTVHEVQRTLAVDYCKILELQPGRGSLFLRAGVGWRPGLVGHATVGVDHDSQAGYTLLSSTPVVVNDLARDGRFRGPPLLRDHEVTSGISCVIRGNEGTYGVLGVHTRQPRQFSPHDVDFLQSIAGVVASALSGHQARMRLALENAVSQGLAVAGDVNPRPFGEQRGARRRRR